LLGRRKIAPFDSGLKLSYAAVQGIDHAKYQRGLAHNQTAASQGANRHNIEVGRHRYLTQERAVAVHRHWTHRNLWAFSDEVKQTHAQISCESLVHDLQGGHPPTNNTLLAGYIVRPHFTPVIHLFGQFLAFRASTSS
jgi:hypothetical protein